MAIVQHIFARFSDDAGSAELWFKYNDNTMKITRAGADNNSGRSLRIRLEDTQLQQAWEQTVVPSGSLDENIGGLNYDAIDVGDPGDPVNEPPEHVIVSVSTAG